ncbi:hypothetical protein R1flu_026131 [Riccia fluitans]|uniref:Bet v I/Major latex protein domain-containing protein n=1 Tax=Riccia fluitans TaxID=41844 RepID=A0ABD1XJ47_9MARC
MPTFTQEIELDVAAAGVWNSLKDQHTVFPKIAPQVFSSIDHVEGPDDSIRTFNLHPGSVHKVTFGPKHLTDEAVDDTALHLFAQSKDDLESLGFKMGHMGFYSYFQSFKLLEAPEVAGL